MKASTPWIKRSSFWTLAVGFAIGGVCVAAFKGPLGIPSAMASSGNSRLAGLMSSEGMATLRALDSSVETLAEAVEPAVVNIQVSSTGRPGMMGQGGVEGEGSGVIFRPDGYIVTNDHVVDGMDKVVVTLTDGRKFDGKVIRSDDAGDIAVVKIDANNLPTLPFADSNKLRPGQITLAVGSPFGLDNSVTVGHLSALDRSQTIPDPRLPLGFRAYPDLIQTDAAINPGNSGGALVNIDGEIVGINTMIATESGSSSGIGFAIPSNQAHLIADMLIQKGTVTRGFLGLSPAPLKEVQKQKLGVSAGAYVAKADSDMPAGLAGIKAGDVIVRIGNVQISSFMDVQDSMYNYKPGDTVQVEVVRDGAHKTFDVKLGSPELAVQRVQQQEQQQQQQQQGQQGQNPFRGFNLPNIPGFPGFPNGDGGSQAQPHTGAVHLGATVGPIDAAARSQYNIPNGVNGVVVAEVQPGSVAEHLGLQPGDVIEEFDGKQPTSPDSLVKLLSGVKWGDQGTIKVERWSSGGHGMMQLPFTFR